MTRSRPIVRDNRARFAGKVLAPEQEAAAMVDLDDPLPREQAQVAHDMAVNLISGVPGSGKTLIAMYRVSMLAKLDPEGGVLFLCHNTPLAAMVRSTLRKEAPRARVDVRTFSSWAWKHYAKYDEGLRVIYPANLEDLVRRLRGDIALPDRLSLSQLISEFDFIDEHLIASADAYADTSRAGRTFSLRRDERVRVWRLYLRCREALADMRLTTYSGIVRSLCRSPLATKLNGARHVVIDEAQFFSPARFELVKRAVKRGGHLFLSADPDQGFLEHRASWKSVGLSVAGRARKLSRSYRTTREILTAARFVLPVASALDDRDPVAPDFTHMPNGQRPYVVTTSSPQDSVDRLVNEVAALTAGGCCAGEILVMYGEQVDKPELYQQLVRRLGQDQVWWMNHSKQKFAPPSTVRGHPLRLAYVKTATGLEARFVFVLGVEELIASPDPGEKRDLERVREDVSNKRLLYMAMTRAAERLVILSSEEPPSSWSAHFELEEPAHGAAAIRRT